MISYHPKDWLNFIFTFHKTDTIRKLFPIIIGVCIYSWIIAYVEVEILQLSDKSHVKNISLMHGMLGFVISMLLVFRTNTAYDRWWEGRRQWGSLVNNSRNLAIKLGVLLDAHDQHRIYFAKLIPAYAIALRNHLGKEQTRLELFDEDGDSTNFPIDYTRHVPNQIAFLMMKRVNRLFEEKLITGEQLLFLNTELQTFTDICGACERIKNTPIPYSYSAFLKKFIFIYAMTLPFGYVFNLGYIVVPVVAFIFYVLASLELIAEEIEEPFGGDANDLPMDKMTQTIVNNVRELMKVGSLNMVIKN